MERRSEPLVVAPGALENLEASTAPVAVVYVLDGGDEAPRWLPGTVAIAAEPLTIYAAWSVATQLVRTPLVMNLNLDDRLAPGAIGMLEEVARVAPADLVGGEWAVTYDQAATDAVGPVRPAADLPYAAAWPPRPGTATRLGSGTGERDTYGPASMWRTALHQHLPYPWRFGDGAPIRSMGDALWWTMVGRLGHRMARVPSVVGHYHSHPGDQAEFREHDDVAHLRSGIDAVPDPLDRIAVRGPSPSAVSLS